MRFLVLLILTVTLSGQSDRGVITGAVTDATGASIPGARVTAVHVATNVEYATATVDSGDFAIPALPAGSYRLRVSRDGFKTTVRESVQLAAGGEVRLNLTLELGSLTESVQVTGTLEQLQTSNARITSQVANKMVDQLPLVVAGAMRNAIDLAMITPEAKNPAGTGVGDDNTFALGGGQVAAFGITLDGISANISRYSSVSLVAVNTPSLDAITEFTVETNGFKAEFGRAAGGTMTFASKSGTNDWHGTAYEFIRNDALDARRFFEARKGSYKQHDFGWSVGGPILLPKLYDGRNKTFFFAAGEWFRNRVGAASQFFSVPTPEMYQGDFRNWVDDAGRRLAIYDPATTRSNPSGVGFIRDAFPQNAIPLARFASFSRAVLKEVGNIAFPNNGAAPGTSSYVRNNYINTTGTLMEPWNKFSIKLDHSFGANDKLGFLFNRGKHNIEPGLQGFPGLPGLLNTTSFETYFGDVYRATYSKVIRPHIVNSVYGGWNTLQSDKYNLNATGGWKARGVCLINAWDCDRNFVQVQFSDHAAWGGSAGDGAGNKVYSFGDDLTIIDGKHTWKIGYLYERLHFNGFGRQTMSGQIRGDRRSTSIPGNNNLSQGGGSGFASFLLGESFSGGTEDDRFVGQQFLSHSFYIQDDWKLTPRLTLNLGLRYEFTLPPLEQKDKWSDLDPVRPNPGADGFPGALRFAGFGPGREGARTITPGWYGGIGPRVGLAYGLNNRTVLRAAAARSFGVVKAVTGSTHFDGAVLVFRPTSTDNGITPAFRLDQGLPPYQKPPSTDPAFANGNNVAWWNNEAVRLPESYDWTFSIQRQATANTVVEASYNATVGAHLVAGLLAYNQLPFSVFQRYGLSILQSNIDSGAARAAGISPPYPSFRGSVAQGLRPFPQYLSLDTRAGNGDKSGHSSYHALVLKLDKRFSRGFTVQGSYVLSKLITDSDSYNADNSASDHYNRRLEKSIGQYDQTHSFKMSYVWELPFGRDKRFLTGGAGAWLLGGWRVSAIHMLSSGAPLELENNNVFNLFNGRNPAWVTSYEGWTTNLDNPNWLGGDRFFQPRQFFGDQPRDRLGNATRHNPKARTFPNFAHSVSVARSFRVSERLRIDLRGEGFNIFNSPRFTTGSRTIDDPNFGVVRSQINEPRRMQVAMKVYF
ncbi:MAG: TonB-dependent receptor [Acidobacteria bacterium]|nr:TonB-dependent receptor [Acidobacteriota bacterium]